MHTRSPLAVPTAVQRLTRFAGRMKKLVTEPPHPREAPLPLETRQPMAGAYAVVLFSYMTTLPDYASYAWFLWGCAVLGAGAVLWRQSPRPALVGGAGALLCVLAAQAVRMSAAPDLAAPVLGTAFAGTLMGAAANSPLGEWVTWIAKIPSRIKHTVGLVAGGVVLFAMFTADAAEVRAFVQGAPGTSVLLMLALSAAIAGALVVGTAGWVVGRAMRRLAGPAAPDDRQALEHWEAFSRW